MKSVKGSKAKTQAHVIKGKKETKGIIEALGAAHVGKT
jgi:hypothetical protein